MPIMDGLTTSRSLRSEGYANIIVGLTGNALDSDIADFIRAGAGRSSSFVVLLSSDEPLDLVFPKPLKLETLDKFLLQCEQLGCKSLFPCQSSSISIDVGL